MSNQIALSAEMRAALVAAWEDGASNEVAADAVGISAKTLGRWLQAGAEDDGPELYQTLVADRQQARGRMATAMLRAVKTGAADDPKHAAWLLACHYPETYAARSRLEHSGPNGGPIAVADHDKMVADAARSRAELAHALALLPEGVSDAGADAG